MLVIHVAVTPLAGSPIQIVNALNLHRTDVRARLVVHSPRAYGKRTFTGDLEWSRDHEETLSLFREADVVQIHHYFELDNNPFGINFHKVCRRAKFLRQFHTHPLTIAHGDKAQALRIISSTIPQLVIAQYHERFYPRARIVPNIVPLTHDLYKPITRNGADPALFFTPTVEHAAWDVPAERTRWDTKGASETVALLHNIVKSCGKGRVVVRRNIPHEQCLREKQASDIVIDEMVTGSYHLASLEALAQGLPAFAYLDARTLNTLAELTGTHNHPWLNFRIEEAERPLRELIEDAELRRELGACSRLWMETYYNDRDMVSHYVDAYQDLLERPDEYSKLRFDPNSRRMMWLTQRQDDLVWESRRETFAGRLVALRRETSRPVVTDHPKIRRIFRGIGSHLHGLTGKITGVLPQQPPSVDENPNWRIQRPNSTIPAETYRWLSINHAERMDALDSSGIFPPDRQAFHRARYELALDYVARLDVADIACGLGYGTRILKEGGAKAVVGIDSCPEAIAYARSFHQPNGVRFEISDATKTLFGDCSIDAITSFETIAYIPNTVTLLAEFIRILKPGGVLIVSSPNDWGLTEHHCHTWTPFEFMAEINAFFDIDSTWEQNSNEGGLRGIRRWSKATELQAEYLIVIARKPTSAVKTGEM